MAELVAFDSMICVWGLKKIDDRDNMVSRCTALIEDLDKRSSTILIPAPVIGEILAPLPIAEHPEVFGLLTKSMRVQSFDILAAEAYAEMLFKYQNEKHPEDLKAYTKAGKIPRQKVKIDYMIAAIAYCNNADCLYTEDKDLTKFASPFIEIRSVPAKAYRPAAPQIGLFEAYYQELIEAQKSQKS